MKFVFKRNDTLLIGLVLCMATYSAIFSSVCFFLYTHDQWLLIEQAGKPPPESNYLLKQAFQDNRHKICLSPEKNVPWTLNGCMKNQPLTTSTSVGRPCSCGFCGDDMVYLRELRDKIEVQYKTECRDLVVYGAALGKKYEDWLGSKQFLGLHSANVVKRHGTCFFQFVTNSTNGFFSVDGSQNLILIDPARMPYENNRRNTKILKFGPGCFFPWAKKVIWQDAKLLNSEKSFGLPDNYLLHFNRTVRRFGTCVSFMGLPHDTATIGDSPIVSLKAHCDTIVAAAEKRPTVSDNLDVLRTQCERYEKNHGDPSLPSSQLFHQEPLIDSAFIVYDMGSAVCRKFNADLGCSWLDEIHCYSDRDQISFPHVLASSGLRLSAELDIPGQQFRDRTFVDQINTSMVHIGKRSCHWYYRSFSRCMSSDGEDFQESQEEFVQQVPGYRVAVIVAGMLQRFMFASTLEHFIRPMANSKKPTRVSVDYFVSLSTASAKAYRSGNGYTNHFQKDISLPNSTLGDFVDIEEHIRKEVAKNLGSVGSIKFQEIVDIDSEPTLRERRKMALEDNPNEDPDVRFPLLDLRNAEIANRTANANRNLLRMHLAIQKLWDKASQWESEGGFKYDFVVFLRDDSLWLNDFNIHYLTDEVGDIFVPACDARDPPMERSEVNDHILISRRNVASIFGNYYTTMFNVDMVGCMNQLPETIHRGMTRGCNSEMVLKWVTDKQGLIVTKLGQKDVPFQRSANVKLRNGSNLQCFHKFCQSTKRPLKLEKDKPNQTCKNISWDNLL